MAHVATSVYAGGGGGGGWGGGVGDIWMYVDVCGIFLDDFDSA